jgi:hypothetical protein
MLRTQAPSDVQVRRHRWSSWEVYRQAMNDGWGSTCRLCLILVVRWGMPVSGGVKLAGMLLPHPLTCDRVTK